MTDDNTVVAKDLNNVPTTVGINKAHVVSDGKIEPAEKARLQALLGNANAQDTRAYVSQSGVIADCGDHKNTATLVFQSCDDCHYTLTALCTKVFVQSCKNFTLTIDARVVTSTLEVYKCENVNFNINTLIQTFQSDISTGVHPKFKSREEFNYLFWAGTENLTLEFANDESFNYRTGYTELNVKDKSLVFERTQFKTQFIAGKITTEKVVRLDNGFPTTAREKHAFDRRQQENLEILAKSMDIKIGGGNGTGAPSKDPNLPSGTVTGKKKKIGRNEKCPCGSTMKYKVCCGKF